MMNTSTDTNVLTVTTSARRSRTAEGEDELTRLKLDLLKAEVRLAKARAGVAGAEADVKVLSAKLKSLASRT